MTESERDKAFEDYSRSQLEHRLVKLGLEIDHWQATAREFSKFVEEWNQISADWPDDMIRGFDVLRNEWNEILSRHGLTLESKEENNG